MTGHVIKLGKGVRIDKSGKVVKSQPRLSRPAEYARRTKKTWRAAK